MAIKTNDKNLWIADDNKGVDVMMKVNPIVCMFTKSNADRAEQTKKQLFVINGLFSNQIQIKCERAKKNPGRLKQLQKRGAERTGRRMQTHTER